MPAYMEGYRDSLNLQDLPRMRLGVVDPLLGQTGLPVYLKRESSLLACQRSRLCIEAPPVQLLPAWCVVYGREAAASSHYELVFIYLKDTLDTFVSVLLPYFYRTVLYFYSVLLPKTKTRAI